ncbi:MAG TPA: YbaK/EbsC family protein [Acidimicrobiales bacterium]|nr:YbaK/EbsC family protein [Acidimicrobiales bacterium]
MEDLKGSARRVAEELRRLGMATTVKTMPDSTRTAGEAAAAIGCDVAQIVKSLVFRAVEGDEPVLVLMPGDLRVDEGRLAEVVGGPVERASGRFVRDRTGFAIGGVAPVGHPTHVSIYMDEHLLAHDVVWAAAGTPHSVFAVAPGELQGATGAHLASISAGP